jgi:hypothetical protein
MELAGRGAMSHLSRDSRQLKKQTTTFLFGSYGGMSHELLTSTRTAVVGERILLVADNVSPFEQLTFDSQRHFVYEGHVERRIGGLAPEFFAVVVALGLHLEVGRGHFPTDRVLGFQLFGVGICADRRIGLGRSKSHRSVLCFFALVGRHTTDGLPPSYCFLGTT